jgi:hypothetical protein
MVLPAFKSLGWLEKLNLNRWPLQCRGEKGKRISSNRSRTGTYNILVTSSACSQHLMDHLSLGNLEAGPVCNWLRSWISWWLKSFRLCCSLYCYCVVFWPCFPGTIIKL